MDDCWRYVRLCQFVLLLDVGAILIVSTTLFTSFLNVSEGIVHSEMFPLLKTDEENKTRFFQIWLNVSRIEATRRCRSFWILSECSIFTWLLTLLSFFNLYSVSFTLPYSFPHAAKWSSLVSPCSGPTTFPSTKLRMAKRKPPSGSDSTIWGLLKIINLRQIRGRGTRPMMLPWSI